MTGGAEAWSQSPANQARLWRGTESLRRFWEASRRQEALTLNTRPCKVERGWVLDSGTQHGLTEQAHQLAGQHGKAQRRFRGPEVPHVEGVQAEVGLQFLDPVLRNRPVPGRCAQPPPSAGQGRSRRRHSASPGIRIVREQRPGLARRRLAFDGLTHDDEPPRRLPAPRLNVVWSLPAPPPAPPPATSLVEHPLQRLGQPGSNDYGDILQSG